MNKRVGELTVRDLDAMHRDELVASFLEMAAFFPASPSRGNLDALPDSDLRQLVNRARRKLHGLGY
jgi:hypothetical protein